MEKKSKPSSQAIEIHFNSLWSLPTVPDYPTVGKSCCEVVRTPSLREIINTYAETGQIIVHTNVFPDEIEGDSSKLGEYDIVDAWHDAQYLESVRSSHISRKDADFQKPRQDPDVQKPRQDPDVQKPRQDPDVS